MKKPLILKFAVETPLTPGLDEGIYDENLNLNVNASGLPLISQTKMAVKTITEIRSEASDVKKDLLAATKTVTLVRAEATDAR